MSETDEILHSLALRLCEDARLSIEHNRKLFERTLRECGLGELLQAGKAMSDNFEHGERCICETCSGYRDMWDAALAKLHKEAKDSA